MGRYGPPGHWLRGRPASIKKGAEKTPGIIGTREFSHGLDVDG